MYSSFRQLLTHYNPKTVVPIGHVQVNPLKTFCPGHVAQDPFIIKEFGIRLHGRH